VLASPADVQPVWWTRSGRGVRVAVVDSGIHASHPHVGGISGGTPDAIDRIGHGTAVAAAIREKAPDAQLYAVKIFDDTLATSIERLDGGIRWAADAGVHLINLSLGTARAEHGAVLEDAVQYASARGSLIVAADESDGVRWLPGSLEGVLGVGLDWTCPRDTYWTRVTASGPRFLTSGYARPIPNVPLEANLKGISFAVAAMSGIVARLLEAHPALTRDAVVARLAGTGA